MAAFSVWEHRGAAGRIGVEPRVVDDQVEFVAQGIGQGAELGEVIGGSATAVTVRVAA